MKSISRRFSLFVIHYSLFIISLSPHVFSQLPADYQLFRPDGTYLYHQPEDGEGAVVGIRLDISILSADGTEWYNYPSVFDVNTDPFAGWCYSPEGPSWMGYKLLVRPNGDNLLYGINNDDLENIFLDTILIKTQAVPGDSWEFLFAGTNSGAAAFATLTRSDTMTFLGITDSIKVISLGEDSIILSKTHGLVRALNFRDYFPDSYYSPYELAGISAEDTVIGRQFLTYGEIFDYEIGDVFHRRIYVEGGSYPDVYNVYEVLDKYFSAGLDTVYYRMSRIEWWYYTGGLSEINMDTLVESYTHLDEVLFEGSFPTETMWGSDSSFIYSYDLYYDDTFNGRMIYYGPGEIFPSPVFPDTCFDMMGSDFTSYIEGCGSFSHYYGDFHNCMPCQRLDYFKKGEEEWGSPYEIPVGIDEPGRKGVKIYPNPVKDVLNIEMNESYENEVVVKVFSIDGRLLFDKIIPSNYSNKIQVNFDGFSNGIYFINIYQKTCCDNFKILKN